MRDVWINAGVKSALCGLSVSAFFFAYVLISEGALNPERVAETILIGAITALSMMFPFVYFGAEDVDKND